MRLLLDTQVLLWLLAESSRVQSATRQILSDPMNEVFVSAASAWEIAIKASLGKLEVPPDIGVWLPAQISANRLAPLAVTIEHAAGLEKLGWYHRDPFDRLLIAQAQIERLVIVTSDPVFGSYEVSLLPA